MTARRRYHDAMVDASEDGQGEETGQTSDTTSGGSDGPRQGERVRLRGAAALKLHLSLLFGLAVCALAFRFELSRALGGNSFSWAYVGEWPFFAAFGIYFWWFILNGKEHRTRRKQRATVAPEFESMAKRWQEEQRRIIGNQLAPSGDAASDVVQHSDGPIDEHKSG